MGTLWFCLVAAMIVMYVLLDGFDLGAGAIHLLVAKTPEERRQVIAAIAPVWNGNEVWLLAAGGTTLCAAFLWTGVAIFLSRSGPIGVSARKPGFWTGTRCW